jgi:SAM-dependent methyltransferase
MVNFHRLQRRCGAYLPIVCMLVFRSPITIAHAQALTAHESELKRLAESQQLSAADEKRWLEDFKEWAKTQPAEVFGVRLMLENRYRERLAAEGLTPDQINVRYGSIIKTRQDDQEWWRISGNKNYEAGLDEGLPPSKHLAEFVEGKTPGKALDCGMGAGRNAVFLASLGWEVTGVDRSDVAVKRAEELAAKAGVKIHAVRSLYQDFDWGNNQWDLILNVGSWDNAGEPTSTFSKAPLAAALKPGGFLYIENGTAKMDWQRAFMEKLFPGVRVVQRLFKADPDSGGNRFPKNSAPTDEPKPDRVVLTIRKPVDAKR